MADGGSPQSSTRRTGWPKYDTQDYDHIDPHFGVIVKDGGALVKEDATDNKGATCYQIRSASLENLEASDAFFARFMEEVHSRGMKVIIDGVFNHCGSFNKWLDREKIYCNSAQENYEPGAYLSADSPYASFFKFGQEGTWPDNGDYIGWWGHDTLPKLNYEQSPKLYQYIMDIEIGRASRKGLQQNSTNTKKDSIKNHDRKQKAAINK